MHASFNPTIDFSRDRIFSKIEQKHGCDILTNYLNMYKPLGIDITRKYQKSDILEKAKELIYGHIKNVLCGGHNDMNEYVQNFFCCTVAGKKLKKALYGQSDEQTGKGIIING